MEFGIVVLALNAGPWILLEGVGSEAGVGVF